MEFVHRPYQPGETIAAISTPLGEGGIAIIRVVGSRAIPICNLIFSGEVSAYKSHTAHFGFVQDLRGVKIDQALCLVMRGKRSYSGEDTIELQCHGGMVASKRVLEAVIEAGARLASPGEFTLKAFMNGKLDLSQAEAVQQLIGAKSEGAFTQAGKQLEGALSKKIQRFQNTITKIAAILEAAVDFPEEGLEWASPKEILKELKGLGREMEALLSTFHDGQRLQQGIKLCILGCPNTGKSSLMNALLQKERAIVTSVAGTTRDLLEEDLLLNGLHFRLVDTAGVRQATEMVEKEGIRRSYSAMEEADLILFVLDASKGVGVEELKLLKRVVQEKTIVIWNKIDLPELKITEIPFEHTLSLSAKACTNLDVLREKIDQLVWTRGAPPQDEVLLTSLRHKEAVKEALEAIHEVIQGLEGGISPEFLASSIRQALVHLGTILGTNITEDILSSIFSNFCVGK